MKSLQSKTMVLSVLMILLVLVNPTYLWAASDGSDAVAKLQQLRSAQNEHTKIANMKANSIEISKQNIEMPGMAFKKALKENAQHQVPEYSPRLAPGIHRITATHADEGISRVAALPSSIVYGQGKMTYASLDSVYFNFLTDMYGSDTTSMDVGLDIGTGMMFGNTGFGTDSSLIHFYSAAGVIDTVASVPAIDDPIAVWTDMSTEVVVGNLWVVYTRTSNLYAVLQVTSTSESYPDEHIAFDYKIQTSGSNVFDAPIEPPLDIMVNGRDADTLLIGSEPSFSITLGAATEGILVVSWDRNHDGMTDPGDIPVEEYEFSDNDMHDLNPADNIFDFIYDNEMADGLNYVIDDFVFTVYTEDGEADAAVTYYTDPTPYFVTGTVRDALTNDPLEGVIVWGDYAWYDMGPMPEDDQDDGPTIIAITDDAGEYSLFFPEAGNVIVGSWDHLMTTGGLIPDPGQFQFELVTIYNQNFLYRGPITTINGFVRDEGGAPLADIEVRAHPNDNDGGEEFFGFTDETGYYEIGVDPGWFWVEVEGKELIPEYMIPGGHDLEVTAPGPNTADFNLMTPNSMISGIVYLDDITLPGIMVQAWNWNFGWNAVWTDASGFYEVPVYAPAVPAFDDFVDTGYELRVHLEDQMFPNPVIQTSENWNVAAGTVNEDIIIESVTGGIYGAFINEENGDTIREPWNVGVQALNLDTYMNFWANPNEWDGMYQLWLPDGVYEITSGGMDWYGPPPDTITVDGNNDLYDVYLNPVQYDGIFEGRVWDLETQTIIAGADVSIGNEFWSDWRLTGAEGRFSFNIPNGHYYYQVWADGYLNYYGEVDINNDQVYHRIELQELVINGAIGGVVFGPEPLQDVWVGVHNPATGFGFNTMTDEDGSYWFDLPNGFYDIYVDHPEYLHYWDSGLRVSDDTLMYDITLGIPDGAIEGHVYDTDNMMPIMDAGIWITDNDMVNYYTGVDENGYFHVAVTNGTYEVHVDAWGYEHAFMPDVVVNNNTEYREFHMMKMQFMGPVIHAVTDQPNDQGRWVRLEFGPQGENYGEYVAYSIWRLTHTPEGPFYDFIAHVPNMYWQFYSLVAPTLVDFHPDLILSDYESEFMVTGHYDDWNFIEGGHNFGFSIDNIVPGVPLGLSLAGYGDNYNDLEWVASTDADFQYFELYRSESDDFSGLAPLVRLVEPQYTDTDVPTGVSYYYMLKAVDANGNVSDDSGILVPAVSTDGENQIPVEYSLSQNYPNPFNPSTTISFGLPEASHVTLDIFNVLGQKVRTLTDSNMSAGYLDITWDGLDQNGGQLSSGTYIYRLQTADMTFSKKMVLMK